MCLLDAGLQFAGNNNLSTGEMTFPTRGILLNSKVEKLYHSLPPFIQNAAISILGYREKQLRYSGIYQKFYRSISENHKASSEQIVHFQAAQLKKIIYTIAPKIRYYKELFAKTKFPPQDKFHLSDLEMIPVLNKEVIRNQTGDFLNPEVKSRIITLNTSGTTGTPLKIFCNAEVRQKNYAFFSRFLESVGVNPGGSRATLGSRLVVKGEQSKPPFWRYSISQKSLFMSSYHLSEKNIASYIEILKKMKPSYIDAFPSSIYSIAEYALRNGISLHGTTPAIVTSAETLHEFQRKTIEETFGTPVYDQYGSVEMCVFIAQCRCGNYHLNSDYSYVELINEKGERAGPGEEAEVVCTGFINHVMPLIRYRIGDKVLMSSAGKPGCDCGSNFPLIKKVLGRTDDVIRTPDGRRIGRLSGVFRGYPVREAQFKQYRPDEIELLIVKDYQYSNETELKIMQEIRKRTGPLLNCRIKYVERIERGKGGKMRLVISHIT